MNQNVIDRLLKRYEAKPIEINQLSTYQKWALSFFHDQAIIRDPTITVTLQIDITEAQKNYEENYKIELISSFTAFLVFKLLQSLKKNEWFQYREISGQWYIVENPPIFMPIATNDHSRFRDLLIENTFKMNWRQFSQTYRQSINTILETKQYEVSANPETFYFATPIANLPHLPFISSR